MRIKSKEDGKCGESIQLIPHLTQNTIWESDKRTRKHQLKKRLEVSSDSGPSPCISKWSDGVNHRVPKARTGGEHETGYRSILSLGGLSRRIFLNFERFYVRS